MEVRLRRFAERESAVADQWFAEVESSSKWTLSGPIGTGESGALNVSSELPLCGVAKPGFQGDMPRAAHEKIASDLAHILGIPVPPVTLWRNPDGGAPYAISLRAFSQPLTWGQVPHLRSDPEFMANCGEIFASGYVFHTWIADTDHGGNEGNLLVDANGSIERPAIAFIDHAFSMSYGWTEAASKLEHIGSYYQPFETLPACAIANAADWVQGVGPEEIEMIVRRVPVAFLSERRAEIIVDHLVRRQRRIAEFFRL